MSSLSSRAYRLKRIVTIYVSLWDAFAVIRPCIGDPRPSSFRRRFRSRAITKLRRDAIFFASRASARKTCCFLEMGNNDFTEWAKVESRHRVARFPQLKLPEALRKLSESRRRAVPLEYTIAAGVDVPWIARSFASRRSYLHRFAGRILQNPEPSIEARSSAANSVNRESRSPVQPGRNRSPNIRARSFGRSQRPFFLHTRYHVTMPGSITETLYVVFSCSRERCSFRRRAVEEGRSIAIPRV